MSEPLKPLENYMIRPVRDQAPEPEEKEWENDLFDEMSDVTREHDEFLK